jgi:hypothetical protein
MSEPSKESLQAAKSVSLWYAWPAYAVTDDARLHLATLIETAYAEHRERVKRIADCAEAASICMAASAKAFDRLEMDQSGDMLRAVIKSLDEALAALKEPHDPVA